jgi:glycerate 2-kinase
MNILIAVDSFKNCLSSPEAGDAIRKGILQELTDSEIRVIPVADGGEGTAEALMQSKGGKIIELMVHNPLMEEILATYVILGDNKTAVIELAKASGIELIPESERNPWVTTTFGTGQLISDALKKGCTKLLIAIGGSATNDAGIGMAQALGVKFFDENNKTIGLGGGALSHIQQIDSTNIEKRLLETEIIVACDVSNPLTGPQGASVVFGPQKGGDPNMVSKLDQNLKHFAEVVQHQMGKDIESIPGAGAAGGLGAGLLAFTNAVLKPGFEIVRSETNLDKQIKWADLIITGEGKMDSQTCFGKTPVGVARISKQFGKTVVAITGTLGEGYQELYSYGFDAIFSILDKPMTLNEALITAPQLLERCGRSVIRLWKSSHK